MTDFTASRPALRQTSMLLFGGLLSLAISTSPTNAQVIVFGPGSEFARFSTIQPTNVDLPKDHLTSKTRQELIRLLDAEQGFARRPVPKGSHGLMLHANGPLDPSGTNYQHTLAEKGISIKPGERVIISDVKISHDRIIFDLNGGPDAHHKWLRHVSIGMDPNNTRSVVRDSGEEPTGSRLTLVFKGDVPELSGAQVKSLIGPIIDFEFKTPVQAFVDTLPPQLKNAILNHQVLVGMSLDMVLYAVGKPDHKSREIEGQTPYEEWIYGDPPKDVEFVRINGNRVIRVETAKLGQTPVIRDKNEVEGTVQATEIHEIKLGDVKPDPDEAQKAPPSLRKPGEEIPSDQGSAPPEMGPVVFPKGIDKGKTQTPPTPPPNPDPPASTPQ